ncbi:MAG: sigma 54-interacting transcriptional regulator [Comamonadaceae bacterium]|nr:sigma 54-interacting transcriptional regulator [Comamonadaceae bacterium]
MFGYEKGAFTGAQSAQAGKFEQARRRHAAARRDLRDAAGAAGQAAARAAGARSGARRRARNRSGSTSASSPPATATWRRRWRAGASARICSTGSTCFPSPSRPCASGPRTSSPLARHFAAVHGARARPQPRSFLPPRRQFLPRHAWPGNVRELENAVQRALILTPGDSDRARAPAVQHRAADGRRASRAPGGSRSAHRRRRRSAARRA